MKRLAILGAALLGGCASFSTMSTARTPVINPSTSEVIRYDGFVFQGGLGFLFGG